MTRKFGYGLWFLFFGLCGCSALGSLVEKGASIAQRAQSGLAFLISAVGGWISGRGLFKKVTLFLVLLCILMFCGEAAGKEIEMDVNVKAATTARLEQMLYPTVRMRAKEAGGSGTVIFSGKDEGGKWQTFVIGCHHVVEKCITVEKSYSPRHGRDIMREHRSTVYVEPFRYVDGSRCVGGAASLEADILAYDKSQDIALVRLRDTARPFEYVATMLPKANRGDIQVSNEIWAVGAALGHKPVMTQGHVSSIDDEIEDLKFVLSSANMTFGHSGGAMFRYSPERKRFEFCGIPARVTIMPKGFMGFETVTWMGYGITIDRIYAFLQEWCYDFIFDQEKTIKECEAERQKKTAEYKKQLDRMYGVVEEVPDQSPGSE